MNVDELQRCAQVLGELGAQLTALPEPGTEAAVAGLVCVQAQAVVLDFARHLAAGLEPYDALAAAARDMPIPDATQTIWRVLKASPKG